MSIPNDMMQSLQALVDGHIAVDANGKLIPTEAKITITDLQAEALGGVEVEPANNLGNAYVIPVSLLASLVRPELCPAPVVEAPAASEESTEASPPVVNRTNRRNQ